MSSQTAAADRPALSGLSLWGAAILLACANLIAVLDVSIANVSVPNIAGALGVSADQGTWVITSYAVAEAITVPLTGWLAGRFGAVRTFAVAMIGFGVCSAACALSPTLGALVFFRVLQGLAGGPLMPLSQTLLLKIFPKKQQPAAMSLWAVTTLVAPILGPVLGGTLCDNFGWAAIFWVNVPIVLLCAPLVVRILRSQETESVRTRVDGVGLGLLVIWVAALQLMLDLGKDRDWFASPLIVGLALVALIGFAAFLIWELTEKAPVVSLWAFRRRGFGAAMITLPLVYGAFFATNVLTPLWLQSNMGYTATWAGYVAGMVGVLAIVMAPIAAQLSAKVDPRRIVFVGVLWLAFVTFMRAGATSQMTFSQISIWLLLSGIGMPLFFMPLNNLALGSVEPEETAGAAGLLNFIRTMSGAVATSLVSTSWANGATHQQAELAPLVNDPQGAMAGLAQGGLTDGQALGSVTQMVQGQAVMLATNQMFLVCAVVFLVAAMVVWIAPRPSRVADTSMAH